MSSQTSTESAPLLDIQSHIATVTLNRPSKRNALKDSDLRCLIDHFATINAATDVRVAILAAHVDPARPVFSAGYDVSGFEQPGATRVVFADAPDALERLRPITIAALSGNVYGGATDLTLACDFRVGIEGMEFVMPAVRLGLHYYGTGMQRYVSRLGLSTAKRLFLLGQTQKAQHLLDIGMLEAILPPSALDAHVRAMAEQIAGHAPLAVQGMKQSLNEIACDRFDAAAAQVRECAALASQDFVEGRKAFGERRKPVFVGR